MTSPTPGPAFEWVNTVVPTDGTATLDLSRSNHFHIDTPTDDFTIAVDNVPDGPYVVDLYLRLTFDETVPTITWPASFTGNQSVFEASGSHTVHMRTWDAGLSWRPATASGAGITRFVDTVGDTEATEFVVTHGLGVSWPIVQLYDTATGAGVIPAWAPVNSNQIQLAFEDPPNNDEYTVVIL